VIGKFFQKINERMEETTELTKRLHKLEDDRRKSLSKFAETEAEVAELRNRYEIIRLLFG
jgi:predicted  nucleic acid-binding Zn-ribbon protein